MSSWLTKRHLGIFLVVSVTTLFAAACASGDQGSQGAKGSQGDAGATGALLSGFAAREGDEERDKEQSPPPPSI